MNRNVTMLSDVERLEPLIRKTSCPPPLSPRTVTPLTSPAVALSPVVSAYGGPLCDAADGTRISVATATANRPRRLTDDARVFIVVLSLHPVPSAPSELLQA